jgi:hypothetical protein
LLGILCAAISIANVLTIRRQVTVLPKRPLRFSVFKIIAPLETSLWNQHRLDVCFEVKPVLSREDQIVLILDGKARPVPLKGHCIEIKGLTPGKHQLQGRIIANNIIQKTTAIRTIYIHYTAILNKKGGLDEHR